MQIVLSIYPSSSSSPSHDHSIWVNRILFPPDRITNNEINEIFLLLRLLSSSADDRTRYSRIAKNKPRLNELTFIIHTRCCTTFPFPFHPFPLHPFSNLKNDFSAATPSSSEALRVDAYQKLFTGAR